MATFAVAALPCPSPVAHRHHSKTGVSVPRILELKAATSECHSVFRGQESQRMRTTACSSLLFLFVRRSSAHCPKALLCCCFGSCQIRRCGCSRTHKMCSPIWVFTSAGVGQKILPWQQHAARGGAIGNGWRNRELRERATGHHSAGAPER